MAATSLLSQCTPVIFDVPNSCGCSLTRADLLPVSPQFLEDNRLRELGFDRIIAREREARIAGAPQRILKDLILSRVGNIRDKINPQSAIAPYFIMPQRTVVNANFWQIEAGAANANAGVGSVPASAWDVTIINDGGSFASQLVNIENYFIPGNYVQVVYKDAASVARSLVYKIYASANANVGVVEKAAVTLIPNYSAAGWAALSAGDKAVYQITHGGLITLANSTSNYESWCQNRPSVINWRFLVFWLQWIRETHCYNDEWLKAYTSPNLSEYYKKFRQLSLSEQRSQQHELAEKDLFNTVFFGQRIDEQQTVGTVMSLPKVYDPANPNCVIEIKATTLGIEPQLQECGRVIDLQGGALDLDLLFSTAHLLARERVGNGGEDERPTIDFITDRFTRDNIFYVMTNDVTGYYKKAYGVNTTRFWNQGVPIMFDKIKKWEADVYQLPRFGINLAIYENKYFEDHMNSIPAVDRSVGRYLMGVDWSDFMLGLAGTASAQRQTNIYDNLYNCVITPIVSKYMLNAMCIAVMVPRPNRHVIFKNFGEFCPTVTTTPCEMY